MTNLYYDYNVEAKVACIDLGLSGFDIRVFVARGGSWK